MRCRRSCRPRRAERARTQQLPVRTRGDGTRLRLSGGGGASDGLERLTSMPVAHAASTKRHWSRAAAAFRVRPTMNTPTQTRVERDFLGARDIPADAYWGVHSARAVENFPISGHTVGQVPELVRALAYVKKAAAQANVHFEVVDPAIAAAIVQACDEVIAGELHEQFVVDVIQGGAGTSTNMNANEVLANRALELLGLPKGRYDVVHPNDHVNASQSTNDVYPTALRLAAWFGIQELLGEMAALRRAFEGKAA